MEKNAVKCEDLKAALRDLSREARELYLGHKVTEMTEIPSPIVFYREFVSPNKPLVVRGGASHWPAVSRWTNSYLKRRLGDKEVTVTVTPNGLADAPQGDLFVMPEERRIKMANFLNVLERPETEKGVFYIQKQNSNLTVEFSDILGDMVEDVDWATEAFGKKPDAVNFWMGDSRAVTSMHKDPYENMYCVVRGQKNIILHPPTDLPWVPYREYLPAIYQLNSKTEKFDTLPITAPPIPWVSVDPMAPDLDTFPEYANATKIEVRLEAGDMLYLPSLWFHHVTQSDDAIAVNFWYDMEYDIKYNYYNLISNIKKML